MAQNIIDAEFETIRRDDGRHPVGRPPERSVPHSTPVTEDQIEILKSARPQKQFPGRRAQIAYILSVLFSSIAAFLVSGGHVLLRAAPPAQGELALHLTLPAQIDTAHRRDVTTVNATVRNDTRDFHLVPDVLLTFRSVDGTANLIYRVQRGETLQPGKSLAFTVRMPKKPGYEQAPSLRFDTNGV